jgi:hypothetical protein
MKICDICQRELEEGNYYEYSDDEWRAVVRNGFSIFREDIRLKDGIQPSFAQVASALGVSPAEAEAKWRERVLNGRGLGGMALCPDCDAKAAPFRKR